LVYLKLENLLSIQPHSFHFCIHTQFELMNFWMETLATLNKRFVEAQLKGLPSQGLRTLV
jgi:hypothetical protein